MVELIAGWVMGVLCGAAIGVLVSPMLPERKPRHKPYALHVDGYSAREADPDDEADAGTDAESLKAVSPYLERSERIRAYDPYDEVKRRHGRG